MAEYKQRGLGLGEIREKMGISETEAAKMIGIPCSTYYNYECGKNEPSVSNACKIARFYGVTVEELAEKCGWI